MNLAPSMFSVERPLGRPLGLFPIATGLTPDFGGVVDAVVTLGFFGLGERKASGLVRGFRPWTLLILAAPAPGL